MRAHSYVKSPIKKSSLGEPPREAFPTDCVTSSYGVGPTDENGRPLFGLSALRRRQNTVDHTRASEPESESDDDKPRQVENKPSEIYDSTGRPLFGGLRALKATSTSVTSEASASTTTATSKSSILLSSHKDKDTTPKIRDMPERQVSSSQLHELVSKHEQHSRGNTISQPSAPRQKPKAKLRDSFIVRSQEKQTEDISDTRVISQRGQSLRAIIRKHESISNEPEQERISQTNEDYPSERHTGDLEVAQRPGILKKPRDDQIVTETTSTSSATFISSRGTVNSDGTVSLTRDIIQGESIQKPGEEPVTKITRSKYTYNTPENDSPALCYEKNDYDHDDLTRKSSTSNRRSSSGKTPSPERSYPDESVKSSKYTTSSVSSTSSTRRSRVNDDDRKSSFTSKYDKLSSSSDDHLRRKLSTEKCVEDDKKFVSSTTAVLSGQQRTSDRNEVMKSRSSPVRTNISDDDHIPGHSSVKTEKYISSSTATVTRTSGKMPDTERRQIFTDGGDEEIELDCSGKSTAPSYEKYSTTTTVNKSVTNNLIESERTNSAGTRGSGDNRLSHLRRRGSDDDGYQTSSHYTSRSVTESATPKSTRSYSRDLETDEQMQKSEVHYSSSSVTQSSVVETSSVPKQLTGSDRRRSSTTFEGERESSPTSSVTSSGFSRLARGGSVRALSQKFQQATGEANSSKSSRSQQSYPKAGLIFRSSSFRQSNSPATTPTEEKDPGSTSRKHSASMEVRTSSSGQSTPQSETEGKSFLTNQTPVTGVQDVLHRMKNADQDVQAGDTEEDAEARSLLNKFLGAQVILQGMEPLLKGSQSAALVSQVERQRLSSQKILTSYLVFRLPLRFVDL
ncbi:hypothetical protein C0J52_21875 [Blattella germanica]|nr:hypothetical protein C0J52_21875 [Blattella germanica]